MKKFICLTSNFIKEYFIKSYKSLLLGSFLLNCVVLVAQIPQGYYDSANGLVGNNLKIALHNIIKNHNAQTYSAAFQYFEQTDKKPNGKVWDIYSDVPGGTPPYEYTFFDDQCGTYTAESHCYNREHTWPVSWFGGTSVPLYTDLHALYPTDGWVNAKRANYPYGKVNNPSWTSQNGSKLGPCVFPGYTGVVFEPIDAYKGDLARTFFYITVRYFGEDANWSSSPQTIGADLTTWSYNLLYQWHIADPVSQKEINRNNAIYNIQNNRNPFIDHPAWIDSILFPLTGVIDFEEFVKVDVYPNPTTDNLYISATESLNKIKIYNAIGRQMKVYEANNENFISINVADYSKGYYFVSLFFENQTVFKRFIKQ